MTMSLVQTVTVGVGGAASISFTGIPQTGQDLLILWSHKNSGASGDESFQSLMVFNGVNNMSARRLYGRGSPSAALSDTQANPGAAGPPVATANTFSSFSIYIPNYTNTTTNKSWSADAVTEANASASFQTITAGLNSSTAAVSSIVLSVPSMTLLQYSTASLYTISTTGATGATVA